MPEREAGAPLRGAPYGPADPALWVKRPRGDQRVIRIGIAFPVAWPPAVIRIQYRPDAGCAPPDSGVHATFVSPGASSPASRLATRRPARSRSSRPTRAPRSISIGTVKLPWDGFGCTLRNSAEGPGGAFSGTSITASVAWLPLRETATSFRKRRPSIRAGGIADS